MVCNGGAAVLWYVMEELPCCSRTKGVTACHGLGLRKGAGSGWGQSRVGGCIYVYVYLSIHIHIYMCIYIFMYPSTYLPTDLPTSQSIYPPMHLSFLPSIHPSFFPSVHLFIHVAACPRAGLRRVKEKA